MNNISLIYVSNFTADTGVSFDLLASPDLKRFFIQLEPLKKSIARYFGDDQHFVLGNLTVYQTDFKGYYELPEVVALGDLFTWLGLTYTNFSEKIFPYKIFTIADRTYPIETDKLDDVLISQRVENFVSVFYSADKKLYFVDLAELNSLLGGDEDPSPAFVKAAIQYAVYQQDDKFFCELCNVVDILKRLNANDLLKCFYYAVFMYPTPGADNGCHLNVKLSDSIPFANGTFKIYEGCGFGMNKFFFNTVELAELLDVPNADDENPFTYSASHFGEFWNADDGANYCRLDYAERITHRYLTSLWNGHNETNDRIRLGWEFINWIKKFLSDFYKAHGVSWNSCYRVFNDGFNQPEPAQYKYVECVTRKDLVTELADRFDIDKETLINFLLETRIKQFDEEQNELKEELL